MSRQSVSPSVCPWLTASSPCALVAGWVLSALILAVPGRTDALPLGHVVRAELIHTTEPGDTLTLLGARHGVSARLIARDNDMQVSARLGVGQRIRIDSRHLFLPEWALGVRDALGQTGTMSLVVNLPQRMLFVTDETRLRTAYPVAAGRAGWATPIGPFTVINKETDKTWYVPRSIQEEMRREGRPVLKQVPPGPDNPLGRHWIGLSLPSIGIHGTNAPASVYGLRSHGCIRMQPQHIEALYQQVTLGTGGRTLYQAVILMRTEGQIWLEANPDTYRREAVDVAALRERVRQSGLSTRMDWTGAAEVLRLREGRAQIVGLVVEQVLPNASQAVERMPAVAVSSATDIEPVATVHPGCDGEVS